MDKLKKFLEGSVVIPYSEELLGLIDEACHSFIPEGENEKYETIELMAECFFWGKEADDFQRALNDSVSTGSGTNLLPKVVVQRLAAYECYIMIMEDEDDRISAVMATIFMNYILSVKRSIKSVVCGDMLLEIYDKHISKYIKKNDCVSDMGDMDLIKGIAEAADSVKYITEVALPENDEMPVKDSLKGLAKAATYYVYDRLLSDSSVREIQDPFVKVFLATSSMMQKMTYCYYDYPFYTKIMNLLDNEESKQRKSISKIIESLRLSKDIRIYNPLSGSSLILRLLYGDKIPSKDMLYATQINVKEFCVYLYYELLIENILNQNIDNGE